MKKRRFPSARLLLLFFLSAVLILLSAAGSTRATLMYYSENYSVEVAVSNIGVSLLENGEVISCRNYKEDRWAEKTGYLLENRFDDERLVPGRRYPEELSVVNSGAIDSYVRVVLYKSWKNARGGKDTTLFPELIGFEMNLNRSGWIEDRKASTPERAVYYYRYPLSPGQETPALCRSFRLDPSIWKEVTELVSEEENGYRTITTTYAYDGYSFCVNAETDTVQTHNAQEALKSAWGIDANVGADGSLNLQ